jgi:hypothetical protein
MWTDRERTHIGGCPLCQKTLSHAWRAAGKCPSVWQVFQYWYLGREFELAGALKLHVRRDGCRRCRLLMCSSWLVGVAELFENGKQSWEQLRDWLSPAFCLLAPAFVPIPVGADKFDDGCTPFIKSETNSDGSAGVTVEVSRTGHLELTVESTTTDFQQVLVIGAETATLTPLAQSESGSRAVDLESSQEEQLLVLVPRL